MKIAGQITVNSNAKLDYETNKRLRLIVVATANNAYGYTTVWVNLRDANDNAPRFTQERYVSAVWEGKTAWCNRVSSNIQMERKLRSLRKKFVFPGQRNIFVVRSVEFQSCFIHSKFDQKYSLYFFAGNTRGTYVTQISATDVDEGANGRITYSIIGGNSQNAFVIDPPNTGIVKTNIILDREIKESYRSVQYNRGIWVCFFFQHFREFFFFFGGGNFLHVGFQCQQ